MSPTTWGSHVSRPNVGDAMSRSVSSSWARLFGFKTPPAPLPSPCTHIAPGRKLASGLIVLPHVPDAGEELEDLMALTSRTYVLVGTCMPPLLMGQTRQRGSYGKLRMASDVHGKMFAVKEFRSSLWRRRGLFGQNKLPKTQPTTPANIEREAQLSALARGTLCFYDLIDVDDKIYGIMPYYDGMDLFELAVTLQVTAAGLGRNSTGMAAVMTYVGAHIAQSLADLHDKGFVHNDTRLENILWRKDGTLALADFGRAKPLINGTLCVPTPSTLVSHMAPESLAAGELPLTAKIDVWSFGVSVLDLWLGASHGDHNPFAHVEKNSELARFGRRFEQIEILQQWAVFRAAYCKTGTIEHNPSLAAWGVYRDFEILFGNIRDEDDALADYLMRHWLNPDAAMRPDAAAVMAFCQAHLSRQRRTQALHIFKAAGAARPVVANDAAMAKALRRQARNTLAAHAFDSLP